MNNLSRVVGNLVLAGIFADFARAFLPMRFGLIALLTLLVVDFRYTRRYQIVSGKTPLPFCKALKLFFNKALDYIGYLAVVAVLSLLFDGAIEARVTRWAGMGIMFTVEAWTIIRKWLRLYHPDIDFDLLAALGEKWGIFRHIKKKDHETDQTGEDRPDLRGGENAQG